MDSPTTLQMENLLNPPAEEEPKLGEDNGTGD